MLGKTTKMKTLRTVLVIHLLSLTISLSGQHTFSIVATDSITREVGGAGATCLSIDREGFEALIISDLYPGLGAIHTQSYWDAGNQYNAGSRALDGLSAPEIIEWLVGNDVSNDPSIRQYGIALFRPDGSNSAAGYTGSGCLDTKYHVTGRNYSIQGNILIGRQVIDSMERRFLAATGSLADRLMEAMRGAKIPGADKRCLSEGLSSRSSFVRVARPSDSSGYYLDLHVGSTRTGLDPIDSLDVLYKQWKSKTFTSQPSKSKVHLEYLPFLRMIKVIADNEPVNKGHITLFDVSGRQLSGVSKLENGEYQIPDSIQTGIYFARYTKSHEETVTLKIKIP